MLSDNTSDSIFIIVSLFLLVCVAAMLVGQLIIWLIIKFGSKKNNQLINNNNKSYQILLAQEKYDGTIKKVKIANKFNNYDKKTNCLKLKANDFEEKTSWNCYHNLISVLMVKWKKTNRKTYLTLIISTLIFYLSVVLTLTCTLIYYLTTINHTLLSILSFITLVTIVLSWLVWTMTYEKVRKALIDLVNPLENPALTKTIKKISAYKTLFPSSELLF